MPTRCLVRRLASLLALPLALALPAAAPSTAASVHGPASTSADAAGDSSLLLMLDASGSMKKDDPSGLTKIEAAKKALTSVVDALPDGADVGLRVYGATVDSGGKPTKAACADTQLVTPVGPLDRSALTTAITTFRAVGETPIAHSLDQALDDLPDTGKRTIVMVSDGQESCVPDPCPVVEKLLENGVDLRIDTVGFAVDTTARTQLRCIAAAGGGTYYDAADADQLTTNLTRISVRAARQFSTTGTPVTGATAADQALPTLTAGQYVDTFTAEETKRYVLRRTVPHSTLHVAVTARPGVDLDDGPIALEVFTFNAVDEEGRACARPGGNATRGGMSELAPVVSDSARVDGGTPEEPGRCGAQTELAFEVERRVGSADPADVEILVLEEPPVADSSRLPPPVTPVEATPAAIERARPVVGGTTFSDAALITPGTWTEQYVSGETIFYRFPLDWGQAAKVTARVEDPSDSSVFDLFTQELWDPTRSRADSENLGAAGVSSDRPVVRAVPEVRYRNREATDTAHAALAGPYYLSISAPLREDGSTIPLEVTFTLETDGEVTGAPGYVGAAASSVATSTASPTPSADGTPVAAAPADETSTGSSGVPLWVWLAGGVVLVVALVVGAAFVLSRRDPTST